ncbi:MAG: hypothetical protein ACJ752_04200 [Gaiellaceae bacterium]
MRAEDDPQVEQVPLTEPRPLSEEQRRLLEHLARAPLGKPGLRAQIEAAQVVAECSCGCPSVGLEVDQSVPSVSFDPAETPDGRTDHVALTARRSGTELPEVTLHLIHGRLFELEVWAGYGIRPGIDIRSLKYA